MTKARDIANVAATGAQPALVSGTNIKTVNSTSLLGSGNVAVEPTITAGTTAQYWRGDKSWQTLDKTAVGLGNVDNTSDANKPISTATQTALNAKQNTLVSGTNIKTVGGTSLLGSGDISVSTRTPVWTAITATGTYTVPSGVTSIRAYAFGKGGDGSANTTTATAGGGGGGCAYGDIAVTAGQSVSISISGGVATVSIGGTTYLTANPGANASGSTGGAGGSASKHASVTNGGAYSGGTAANGNYVSGGASSGSPLGNGFGSIATSATPSGGGGWGGLGSDGGGGGAGGDAYKNQPGGAGGSAADFTSSQSRFGGVGRSLTNLFTDPLLIGLTAPGVGSSVGSSYDFITSHGGPGAGGAGLNFSISSVACYAANGGTGGGGGGIRGAGTIQTLYGGAGGFGGGGGGAWGGSGSSCIGGNGGYGGGGGGAGGSVSSATAGTGGAAIVLIYA